MVTVVVGAGRRPGPVMVMMVMVVMRLALCLRRQAVVEQRGGGTGVRVRAAAATGVVAVGLLRRVLAAGAAGHFVLNEPANVRQRERPLALTARQQVHLIGAAGAVRRVRVRCENESKRDR